VGTTEDQNDTATAEARNPPQVACLHFTRATSVGTSAGLAPAGTTIGRISEMADSRNSQDGYVGVADPRMSSRHAVIRRRHSEWLLEDLRSRNGAFVDGAKLRSGDSVVLRDQAIVRIGDTVAVFTVGAIESGPEVASDAFPGGSLVARRVRRRIHRLNQGSGHVLVLGETGSGKERVARAIAAPVQTFTPLNCAELSKELARAELFGHVRGAFSGATNTRPGLVAAAHEGVLFLDEVAELPMDVQAELLRFLEDGHYRAVGTNELSFSSARVIAATNVDLDRSVRDGTFRRDLLARLRTHNAPVVLPALRERRDDIYMWCRHFLSEGYVGVLPGMPLEAGALECLLLYPWNENLRELRGVLRSALESSEGFPISPAALPEEVQAIRRQRRVGPAPDRDVPSPTREHVEAALRCARGRIRAAAESLHIERTRLYRLCAKLDIDIQSFRIGD
jgi:DNA-binding NtrC family response regulator